jgi:hypothetical protein
MHSCPYCVDAVTDLVKAANALAKILNNPPQIIGHNARSRAAQLKGAEQTFGEINACVAARHLAEFPARA